MLSTAAGNKPTAMDGKQLHGIVVVDKPVDISSAGVVARVKRLLKAAKVGHTGTLDPSARGVLICCVNNATRLARFLQQGPKKYQAMLKLGVATDTQDATGMVLAVKPVGQIAGATIRQVMKQYEGSTQQTPPVFSALKHKGVPLYRLARRGRPVRKPPRSIYIDRIRVVDIQMPLVRFEVTCLAGTYVRTLCADIGKALGCGGHLQALTRIESGGFSLDQARPLTELEKLAAAGRAPEALISMADALPHIPQFFAAPPLLKKIRHGQAVTRQDLSAGRRPAVEAGFQGWIKILDENKALKAILEFKKAQERAMYSCVFP